MSIDPKVGTRKAKRAHEFENGQLYGLLIALGFSARDRVSVCTKLPGGPFVATLYEVRELAGWSPPQDRCVWFGVNPVARHVRHGRGTEADIARVRALFADLDVKPGKQFASMRQCYEAARRLEDSLMVAPVAAIESGHGLQPLWRVASPAGDSNVVGRTRSCADWKTIYARWGSVVQQAARQAMWTPDGAQNVRTIDNVYDLSRVLRCPGSVNWKNPEHPVPVRTTLLEHGGRVRPRDLVRGLDRDGITPLAKVSAITARVATDLGEAKEWIAAQRGAELDLPELEQLPRSRVLHEYLDPAKLVEVLAGPNGAHETMRGKVLHAVLSAQEGRAGLAVALNNLQAAYLEVMDARSRGEIPGEVRSAATPADDYRRAVVGAVAKARARGTPVVPDVDAWAPVVEVD